MTKNRSIIEKASKKEIRRDGEEKGGVGRE